MAAIIVAGGAVIVGGLVVLIAKKRGSANDLSKVPGPKGLPIVGNALQLLGPEFHRTLANWAKEHGGIFQFSVFGKVSLYVSDLETLKIIFKPPPDGGLPKNLVVYGAMNNLTSVKSHPSVMTYPDYLHWRAIRHTFDPAFSTTVLPSLFPTICEELQKVIDQMSATGGVYEMADLAARLALNMTGKFSYSMDLGLTNLKDPAPLLEALRRARIQETQMAKTPIFKIIGAIPLLPKNRQHGKDMKTIHTAFEKAADSVRGVQCPMSKNMPLSIPCALQELKKEATHEPVSKLEQNSNVALFGIAGSFPAAYIATYSLYEIAAHPEVLAKVEAELQSHGLLGKPRSFTFEVMDKLVYLNGCIKEGVRFHNVVPQVNRVTSEDVTMLAGYRIPKGIPVFVGIAGVHHSPDNYIEPEKYWPERWLYDEAKVKTEFGKDGRTATPIGNINDIDGSFIPFSSGSRICLGKHVAWLQSKAIVAQLVSAFKISLDKTTGNPEQVIKEEMYAITINPSKPINLVFVPRK